jgi:hypothetical protein
MRAVPSTAVFCSFLMSCFPGMLLRYCLSGFEIVPVAPVITGITFVFTSTCAKLLLLLTRSTKGAEMEGKCNKHV